MENVQVDYDVKHSLMRGAVVGAAAAAGAMLLFGEGRTIPVFGQEMPAFIPVFLATGAASVATDLTHSYVLPHIPGNQKYAQAESAALAIVASGGITYGLLNLIQPVDALPAFGLGAGAYIGGSYIHDQFLNKDGILF